MLVGTRERYPSPVPESPPGLPVSVFLLFLGGETCFPALPQCVIITPPPRLRPEEPPPRFRPEACSPLDQGLGTLKFDWTNYIFDSKSVSPKTPRLNLHACLLFLPNSGMRISEWLGGPRSLSFSRCCELGKESYGAALEGCVKKSIIKTTLKNITLWIIFELRIHKHYFLSRTGTQVWGFRSRQPELAMFFLTLLKTAVSLPKQVWNIPFISR